MKYLLSLLLIPYAFSQVVTDEYIRLLPPSSPATAAFMKITNDKKEPLKLVSADSDIAKSTEIHDHLHVNGMMKMQEVKEIVIAPGETKELKPGSLHIMLMGLKRPLKENEEIDIKLTFKGGKTMKVSPKVKPITPRR